MAGQEVVASQQIEFGQLANLNDLSSLNGNQTAAVGMSSLSAIENLLLIEEASQNNNNSAGKGSIGRDAQAEQSYLNLTGSDGGKPKRTKVNNLNEPSVTRSHGADNTAEEASAATRMKININTTKGAESNATDDKVKIENEEEQKDVPSIPLAIERELPELNTSESPEKLNQKIGGAKKLTKSEAVTNLKNAKDSGSYGDTEQLKQPAQPQRTTMDTGSRTKQQTQTTDSHQRLNFNTSMQVPRGLINTAFSLSSVASRVENVTPKPALPTTPQNILKYYIKELTDYEKGEVLDYERVYFLGKSRDAKNDPAVQAAKE